MTMKKCYKSVFALAAMVIACSAFAETRTWTGGGDGIRWGDSANWDGAIADGDSIVIANADPETTLDLTNDLGSVESPIKIAQITLDGEGAIRISGNPIESATAANKTFLTNSVVAEINLPLTFPNHAPERRVYMYPATNMTFNGTISAPGLTRLDITKSSLCTYNGDILLPNGKLNPFNGGSGTSCFYGRVVCQGLGSNLGTSQSAKGVIELYNSSNDIKNVCAYMTRIEAKAENAFGTNAVLKAGYGGNSIGNYALNGYDQVIDRIAPGASDDDAVTGNKWHNLSSSDPCTVTMRASEDSVSSFAFGNQVSVVWEPQGDDIKFIGRARTHSMYGKLTVKRGTMEFLDTTKFTNLSEIEIAAGAKLSFVTTTPEPLPALRFLWLDNDTTSIFAITGGCSVSTSVMIGGAALPAGTYTGDGGTADHVVNWIEGTGVVTVVAPPDRYFSGANDSRWGDTNNWSTLTLPTNDVATYVMAVNGVTVPASDTNLYDLASFANDDTKESFIVKRGGKVTVSGGSLVITNICGKVRIGDGDASVTSRLEVTSGFLGLYATRSESFAIDKGGILSMTGGTAEYAYGSSKDWRFRMTGGAIDLSNDASFSILVYGIGGMVFGSGTVDVRDNAKILFPKMGNNPRTYWTPSAENETLTVNLSGNAIIKGDNNVDYISGFYAGAKTVVNASGNSSIVFGKQGIIGYGAAGMGGELNISDNAVVSNKTYSGIHIGREGSAGKPSCGKVRISGGLLSVSTSSDGGTPFTGLNIGCEPEKDPVFTDFYNRGSLEISGGEVKTSGAHSRLVVGTGNSYGEVLQSNGVFNQGRAEVRVGWYGGTGLYRFTGGTANFTQGDFYIGSENGNGTLEIGAGTGTFTAKNMYFAGAGATLKFKPGANGSLATLNVTGTLSVTSGAKLVVDATQCTGNSPVTLVTFGSPDGRFAEEDIEILADDPVRYRVRQLSTRIRLHPTNGLLLIVK